jgi:chorismate synthase
MNNNSLGKVFSVTSFGESHGKAVGCVLQGIPAGFSINLEQMQAMVNLRKTNQQEFASARKEEDTIEIISGVFEGKTLGTPLCILIENKDAKSQDYDALKNLYRPNHSDFTVEKKYGFRDHRGGGRSSIRITAPMVAAGNIAIQFLQEKYDITIQSFVSAIGGVEMKDIHAAYTAEQIYSSAVHCPEASTADAMQEIIASTQQEGDTLGGKITTHISNIPAGIGEPIFYKLQAALAQAMLSINTVKGFEYGDGFAASAKKGSEHNDVFVSDGNEIKTKTNHSGGIQGGISNGMPIYFTTAFKPISSIAKIQDTVSTQSENTTVQIGGRHDVCAVPRAVPIVDAYTAIVLLDLLLQQKINQA